jgi:hypothetical protein
MISRKNLENMRLRDSNDLCLLAEKLGYGRGRIQQLQCNNGAFVSSLLEFFDDNPGAMEALVEWVAENHDEVTDAEECGCCGEECSPDGMCITADCENYGNMWNDDGNEV